MHRLYGPGEAKHRAELKRQRAGRHRNHAEIVLAHADCESPTSAALPFGLSFARRRCSPAVARIVALKRAAGAPRIAQRPCSTTLAGGHSRGRRRSTGCQRLPDRWTARRPCRCVTRGRRPKSVEGRDLDGDPSRNPVEHGNIRAINSGGQARHSARTSADMRLPIRPVCAPNGLMDCQVTSEAAAVLGSRGLDRHCLLPRCLARRVEPVKSRRQDAVRNVICSTIAKNAVVCRVSHFPSRPWE
jgi:hypothetical protein